MINDQIKLQKSISHYWLKTRKAILGKKKSIGGEYFMKNSKI